MHDLFAWRSQLLNNMGGSAGHSFIDSTKCLTKDTHKSLNVFSLQQNMRCQVNVGFLGHDGHFHV